MVRGLDSGVVNVLSMFPVDILRSLLWNPTLLYK